MSEESTDKTITKFTFSGKKVDWPVWSEKFLARTRRKEYKKILTGAEKAPDDTVAIDTTTTRGKEMKKLRELNDTAYEDLILFIDGSTDAGRVAFSIVRGAKTSSFKDGDALMAWTGLSNKYESKTAPSRLHLKNQFSSAKLQNAKDDPDVWLTKLEDICVKLAQVGRTMTDEDLLEQALNGLPSEYANVVTKLEDQIGDPTKPLTISKLRDELNLKFERLNGKRSIDSKDKEEGETALFAGATA